MAREKNELEIFAVSAPGLEEVVAEELRALDLAGVSRIKGGVTFRGNLAALARANLHSRCATRVLARVGRFPVFHLAQLHKRAKRISWNQYLPPGSPVQVKATCRRSKIYHSGAAAERVARAIQDVTGHSATIKGGMDMPTVQVRIERDLCVLSMDSSGEPLYRRGMKPESTAAPIRENLAASVLHLCGYEGREPLLDPMCGSGTFVLEAALVALGRAPGARRRFAFMNWPGFDLAIWERELARAAAGERPEPLAPLFASDSNAGSVGKTSRNLEKAGLSDLVPVQRCTIADLQPPAPSGLMVCNPPYGKRLKDHAGLERFYAGFGETFRSRFAGWRLGMITSHSRLARATGLEFSKVSEPFPHGGIRIRLYQTGT
jgi:putative N6-adenine-specific DNA methylase